MALLDLHHAIEFVAQEEKKLEKKAGWLGKILIADKLNVTK